MLADNAATTSLRCANSEAYLFLIIGTYRFAVYAWSAVRERSRKLNVPAVSFCNAFHLGSELQQTLSRCTYPKGQTCQLNTVQRPSRIDVPLFKFYYR